MMVQALREAILPENRVYRYEYFLNNCSTKLRDVIDTALNGALREATDTIAAGSTWRTHTRRLTAPSWFGYLGIQLLLGPRGDEDTSTWDEMWVPMKLRDTMAGLTYTRPDGTVAPVVSSEEVWVPSTRGPELAEPPPFNPLFLLVALALVLVVVLLGHSQQGFFKRQS